MSRRYVLVRLIPERTLSSEHFLSALTDSVRKFFGDFGLVRIDPKLIRFDESKSEAIVACKREGVEDLNAAIALISTTPRIAPVTIRVSGTIKGLRRERREPF